MKTRFWLAWMAAVAAVLPACSGRAQIQSPHPGRVTATHVNVRGQATIYSEVVTQLSEGETVTILEAVTLNDPQEGEPAEWYRIALPADTPVWVHGYFVDDDHKVTATRLNIRAGPGENFSILGRIEQGTTVSAIRTVDQWMEIEPPEGTYAFVAQNLITPQETAELAAATATEETSNSIEPEPESGGEELPAESTAQAQEIAEADTAATAQTETDPSGSGSEPTETVELRLPPTPKPAATDDSEVQEESTGTTMTQAESGQERESVSTGGAGDSASPAGGTALAANEPSQFAGADGASATNSQESPSVPALRAETLPEVGPEIPEVKEEPDKKRIVRREGVVDRTLSIQAPTYFKLKSRVTGRTINYIKAKDQELKLLRYMGRRVIVTGEEYLDERWPKIPVIEIETLELLLN